MQEGIIHDDLVVAPPVAHKRHKRSLHNKTHTVWRKAPEVHDFVGDELFGKNFPVIRIFSVQYAEPNDIRLIRTFIENGKFFTLHGIFDKTKNSEEFQTRLRGVKLLSAPRGLTLSSIYTHFNTSNKKSFEKHCGKW